MNDFANKLNQQRNLGLAKLQTNINEEPSRLALTQSAPTSNQISELIKQELSQIDLAKYLQQLEALTGCNRTNLDNLNISPEEHAQAIARLQVIQAELEKRKKIVQELEQAKIGQQLAEQKHQLEIVQRQIEAKTQEVESAKQAGQTAQAKKLNEEYNELRRKQSAVTAFIVNLEENAAYRTFVKFNSLEELYNPDYSVANASQVTVTETPLT
jgi:signal transduction histidine kinase